MYKRSKAVVFLSTLMAGLLGLLPLIVVAQQGEQAAPQVFTTCRGGAVKATQVKTNDVATTRLEAPAGFIALTGASSAFAVPAGTTDLAVVTFSAECRLFNASPNDWVEVQVRLDGVAMEPSDAVSPMAFCSNDSWEMCSATFCQRVAGGAHTVSVFWKLVDNAPLGVLQGWLDDWALQVQISE